MARKIFVSFLGTGKYESVSYKSWKGDSRASDTRFVQRAIIELYPKSQLDAIVILETEQSRDKHEQDLRDELKSIGVSIDDVDFELISADVSNLSMTWKWFELLQSKFENGDTLILDVTHGFRMVPIVFSAAVAYLKRVKNVQLEAVLYGAHDIEGKPIIDLKDFYTISDWTEGVGRLVDSADASFLRKTAENESGGSFAGLNNKELLDSIESLTSALRNVELQNIEQKARTSLELIENFRARTQSEMEKQVLSMVLERFRPLMSYPPLDGTYSLDYLKLQLRLIQMLADYKLYMQAFTAMNEWLGSLGVFLMKRGTDFRFTGRKEKTARKHADMFLAMLDVIVRQRKEFITNSDNEAKLKASLDGAYRLLLEKYSADEEIANLLDQSKNIRNGFNHGWTGTHRNGAPEDLGNIFANAMATLNKIVNKIEQDEIAAKD